MYDLRQEKLDEMRQDMLYEQAIRADWDFALEKLVTDSDEFYEIEDALNRIQNHLEVYGWSISKKDLFDEIARGLR